MTLTQSNVVALADAAPAADAAALIAAKETASFDARDAQAAAVVSLAVLALIYSFYFGRDLLLPIVMAAVLNLLLQPLMQLLNAHLRLPMPIAALFVIGAVFAAIGGIAYAISSASGGWAQQAPESFAVLKQRLAFLAEPIGYVQELLHTIENMGAGAGKAGAPAAVAEGNALPGILLFGTAATIREFFTTILILYFMLATGDRMLRGLIEVLPRFSDKRRAVEIAGEIQSSIASYLATVTVMNAAVGVVVAAAMWFVGLADPMLWGVIAFLLNFVPIIGPLAGMVIFFVVGVATLPWPFPAMAPVLLYLLIHLIEGQAVTPLLVARRFELNPVLVILSLLFWHAIWGIPGALLAVPLLAIFKIFADRIEPLRPVGHLIGA